MYFKSILNILLISVASIECKMHGKRELLNQYDHGGLSHENYENNLLAETSHGGYPNDVNQIGSPFRVNTINVPIPQAYPVSVERRIPVAVGVAVNRPVAVEVPQPYPVTIERRVPVIVKRPVPYTVRVPVQVPTVQRVEIPIHRPYPVLVPRPVTVPVPRPVIIESEVPVLLNGEDDDAGEGGLEENTGEQGHNYEFPGGLFSIQHFTNGNNDNRNKIADGQFFYQH